MTNGLIGRKLGMTRVFTEDGTAVPVTGPAAVTPREQAAVLAHEIKNPITAVNLALRAVADQLGTDQQEVAGSRDEGRDAGPRTFFRAAIP